MTACKWCGTTTDFPDSLCSDQCRDAYFGESERDLYADERHSFEPEPDSDQEEGDE